LGEWLDRRGLADDVSLGVPFIEDDGLPQSGTRAGLALPLVEMLSRSESFMCSKSRFGVDRRRVRVLRTSSSPSSTNSMNVFLSTTLLLGLSNG
jgi:hypothetical protein